MTIPVDIQEAFARPNNGIPSYITPEYLAESKDHGAIVGIIFVGVLTSLVVGLRAYGRLFLSGKFRFGLDDWLACLGLVLYIAFIVLAVILIKLGSGRHLDYIRYVLSQQTTNLTEVLDFADHQIYAAALYICRLSGLAFYRRICFRHQPLLISIRAAFVFITASFLVQLFLIIFHCIPVTGLWPYEWQPEIDEFKCLIWGYVYAINSALSLACDIGMFAIPTAMVTLLHESLRTKIKLSFILMPGVFVIIVSAVRVYFVVKGGWLYDGAWFYNPQLALESTEIGGTLAALSVPGLKPFFERVFSRTIQGTTAESKPTSSSTILTIGSGKRSGRKSLVHDPYQITITGTTKANTSNDNLLLERAAVTTPNSVPSQEVESIQMNNIQQYA